MLNSGLERSNESCTTPTLIDSPFTVIERLLLVSQAMLDKLQAKVEPVRDDCGIIMTKVVLEAVELGALSEESPLATRATSGAMAGNDKAEPPVAFDAGQSATIVKV